MLKHVLIHCCVCRPSESTLEKRIKAEGFYMWQTGSDGACPSPCTLRPSVREMSCSRPPRVFAGDCRLLLLLSDRSRLTVQRADDNLWAQWSAPLSGVCGRRQPRSKSRGTEVRLQSETGDALGRRGREGQWVLRRWRGGDMVGAPRWTLVGWRRRLGTVGVGTVPGGEGGGCLGEH